MMKPIGTAVSSPAIPTSGAASAPRINGSNPKRAEALPAICPCVCIARENDEVEIIPIDETKMKIGTTTAQSGPLNNTTINRVELAAIAMNRRSEEHTSELQSRGHLVCRLL